MGRVLNGEDRIPLTGLDGSQRWAEDNGYLPITFTHDFTGNIMPIDVWNSELMIESLVTQILSMGKLLRVGWEFHLTGDGRGCYGLTPEGAHR